MSLQMSIVLFVGPPKVSAVGVQDALATCAPGQPASPVRADEGILSWAFGDVEVAVGINPVPWPWSDLEGPCATSHLWRDAEPALRAHRAHAIVTVRGELVPVALATLLTQATAALLAAAPEAIGVLWTSAALLAPRDLFLDFATGVLPHGPPLPIWVDLRVGPGASAETSTGFTHGLAALGLMDLEARDAPEPPAELFRRFEGIAAYLLERGPVIADGDTLGETAAEKIRVVHGPSTFGCEEPVMHLVYESS